MSGSKVFIWKQDPSVLSLGYRVSYIHTEIENGPKDKKIKIMGLPDVRADKNGDFLFNPHENPKEFDAVHTFSIVRQVLTMYERALRRMGITTEINWQWGNIPIQVYPRAGKSPNAYYSRQERSLRFFYFHPDSNTNNPLIYTCRSFDVVAHETGHAILDALQPGYWSSWHAQTGGLHESFGDLTAIFTMLAQMDQCEAIIAESKANLHNKTFFPAIAEQFGEALYGHSFGLRNADNDLKLSETTEEVHDISQVFTGAVYDILSDMFEDHLDMDMYDPAETLFRIGRHIASILITAILKGPKKNVTYKDVANIMLTLESNKTWKNFIKTRFSEREIIGKPVAMIDERPKELAWERCCHTMNREEHQHEFEKAVKEANNHDSIY
jgi:hypothetical protein